VTHHLLAGAARCGGAAQLDGGHEPGGVRVACASASPRSQGWHSPVPAGTARRGASRGRGPLLRALLAARRRRRLHAASARHGRGRQWSSRHSGEEAGWNAVASGAAVDQPGRLGVAIALRRVAVVPHSGAMAVLPQLSSASDCITDGVTSMMDVGQIRGEKRFLFYPPAALSTLVRAPSIPGREC
jgi:hypothetical protein